ncbi:MAG: SDR family NAD(P)-dependent oxidoreductase [Paracoccaceae bacterium]
MTSLPPTPSFDLTGRRALVTGASSGIGAACAVGLARAGGEVTLAARRAGPLEGMRDAMRAEGLSAEALALDASDIDATAAAVSDAGPFDILVNSAGLARHAPALDTDPADYDAVTDINVRGAYFLTRAVAAGLIDAGKPGSLINVSSQMAHVGGIDRAVYCATKHAVEGFTKAMAIEWGPRGIRVNTVCPTFVLTPLTQATFDDPGKRAWIEGKIKLGRVAEAGDVAGACTYLASDAARMVTGTSLLVDGGWTAG